MHKDLKTLKRTSSCVNIMLDSLPSTNPSRTSHSSKNFIAIRKVSPYCKSNIKIIDKEKPFHKIRSGKVNNRFSAPVSQNSPAAKKLKSIKKDKKVLSYKTQKTSVIRKEKTRMHPQSTQNQETARFYGRRESALSLPEALKKFEVDSIIITPINQNLETGYPTSRDFDKSLLDMLEDFERLY